MKNPDRHPRRSRPGSPLVAGAFGLLWLAALAPGAAPADDAIQYNRDIRPILSENCFSCHGPDKGNRKAGLRLDDPKVAVDEQGVIVPGQPDESELVARIDAQDDLERMPPSKSNKTLSAAQKALLRRWVEQGAAYQPHWAYVAPQRPEVPAVQQADRVRNPIDAFILGTLEARGIRPAPEADRRTLLRRLSLDLTGLPPTPEDVEAFVQDSDPRAYERQVDRLLASPHYGERMAVPWLDLARFADTVGYHGDQNQRIFPYRDYVIAAFNKNLPFDRFTVEQLAGDLLPNPTPEQLVATGFNRLNMMTREGGAQPGEYLAKYTADRSRTVATTWLGSTMGCAECHDHKFDPIWTKDFYQLGAFFADVKQWGVYNDYAYTPNPDLRGWSNDHPFPPEIEVENPYLKQRQDRLRGRIAAVIRSSAARLAADPAAREAFDAWVQTSAAVLGSASDGWVTPPTTVDPPSETAKTKGVEEVVLQDDGSLLLKGPVPGEGQRATSSEEVNRIRTPKATTRRFRLRPEPGTVAALRLEVLPRAEFGGAITFDGQPSALILLSAAVASKAPGGERPLTFWHADADAKDDIYSNGTTKLGVTDGWKTSSARKTQTQASVWLLDRPLRLAEGDELVVSLTSSNVGCVRLAVSPFGVADPRRARIDAAAAADLRTPPGSRTPEQAERLHALYLRSTGWDPAALAQVQVLQREVFDCRDGRAFSLVTQAQEPRTARVLPRGNWQDESGEVVVPGVPHFLPQPPEAGTRRLSRLDLARWLTAPENPLTARVFVNRLWKQLFGTGLSAVVDDLGAQGEAPSHPELLDWLAVEFRDGGWDVKHLVKLLVMSSTYRQDTRLRRDLQEIDPANRLLAAQSPRRLEAEFVRDNALAIAGLLCPDLGGPSALPYQPAEYYANLQFPNRDYVAQADERQYRRGVYVHWQRTFLHPMLANFDAPAREECTAIRTAANTPQQALTLLNDPTFVEAARVLARHLPAGTDEQRIDALFRRA
ncbi:MAG TPA: PSD1 and planctomycete cytochrome C domain-containing protein, partial [Isosphaeraceae bacterium]